MLARRRAFALGNIGGRRQPIRRPDSPTARINDHNAQRLDQLLSWNWKATLAASQRLI
jgi:hypothetical protein